jgi:hypothetical protein
MTIQNIDTNELTHFMSSEGTVNPKNGYVDYEISGIKGGFSDDFNAKLIKLVTDLDKQDQAGGKKHRRDDDDDSSSSSDSDSDDRVSYGTPIQPSPFQPITRFVYFHLPYYKLYAVGMNQIDVSRIYLPMFSLPINPTLEIRLDLYLN